MKIQSPKPDFKEEKLIIDNVRYISNNNLFTTAPIHLNQNLNVIIGGKSSGKSILLYNIAKTLETNGEVFQITNVDGKEKYNFRANDPKFDFEVALTSGASQKLYDDKNSIIPNIKYIPQNYLSKLAEHSQNKKGEDLLKYIRGLLLEKSTYNEKYNEFLSKVKQNDKQRNDIIDNYFQIKEYITEKEKELKELGNEEAIKKSIESNTKRIEELKKGLGLTEEQIKDYNTKKEQIEQINSEQFKLNEDYKRFTEFGRETIGSLQELKSKMELAEKFLNSDKVKSEFNTEFHFIAEKYTEINSLIDTLKLEEGEFIHDNFFKVLFNEQLQKQSNISKGLEKYQENDKLKEEVTKIEKTVSKDKLTLQKVNKIQKEIRLDKEELQKEKDKLFNLYLENYKEYPAIIKVLLKRAEKAQDKKLVIEGSVKFNASKFNK